MAEFRLKSTTHVGILSRGKGFVALDIYILIAILRTAYFEYTQIVLVPWPVSIGDW